MTRESRPDQAFGRVLSTTPLVTISKRALWLDQPMGFAAQIPDLAGYGPSVHFVGLCFSLEPYDTVEHLDPKLRDSVEAVARAWDEASKTTPQALYVILANSEFESFLLSRRGVPNILANELIFVDEAYYPAREREEPLEFDAIYNAGFYGFKRHALAAEVDRLALIAKRPLPDAIAPTLALVPKATLLGYDERGWRVMSAHEVARAYARSGVGLCLSAIEGSMRVSMEYQLCGLPIVSTPSVGGRDRYFGQAYTIVVPPDPRRIAEAVREALALNTPRSAIRTIVLEHLRADRRNFVREMNKIVAMHTGTKALLTSFKLLRRFPIYASSRPHPRFDPKAPVDAHEAATA